jgi:hypothetical protein
MADLMTNEQYEPHERCQLNVIVYVTTLRKKDDEHLQR